MSRRTGWVVAAALALTGEAAAAPAQPLQPGELVGESRSLLRDVDRTRTNVAGEADAAAVVANPANMGFLRALGGALEGSWTRPEAQRRGGGVGAFLAVPLSLRLFGRSVADNFLALGVGYQHLRPTATGPLGRDPAQLLTPRQSADMPYNKLSFSVAVPLMRWAPGLSLGLSYSRLWSRNNVAADDLNQFDLALAYRPHRVVALGLVARAINTPRSGRWLGDGEWNNEPVYPMPQAVLPFELDPEISVRPIRGSRALELAFGGRIVPIQGVEPRYWAPVFAPRGRVEAGGRGVRVFAEGEEYVAMTGSPGTAVYALRVMAGLELDFSRVGVALAPSLGARPGGVPGLESTAPAAQGFAGKLRLSAERYTSVADRTGEALRVDLAGYSGDRGMYRLIDLLERLGDERHPVVVLELEDLRLGWAQVEEVREAVLRLRARGGEVAVYLRGAGLKDYFLASAAERIYSHPSSRLSIVGLRVEVFFFAELLAKLGARAEFVRIAEYKSRPEQFEQTTSTAPSAAQRQLLMTDTWNHLVRTIARDRAVTPERVVQWIDAAPHMPEPARALGLVDEIAFADELDARVSTWQGRKLSLKAPAKRPRHEEAFGPGPMIAVLHVDGTMSDGDSLEIPLVGSKLAGRKTLVAQIEKLREDKRVKAVVVRIDSPGGSVACADAVARELDLTARRKPVVISMGNVAASGGYYVATAGQYIFSDALTRTGSIGIFRPKVDLSGTLKLFGIGVDEISIGANAGMYSWLKPYSAAERAAAQQGIEASYQIFVQRVARARAMAPADVDRLARGRIWSGVRAQEIGLVDAYGGLREAVLHARSLAKLGPRDGEVRHFPPSPTLVDQIEALFGLRLPSPLGARAGRPAGAPTELVDGAALWVLRRLPASLWLMSSPEPLALAEEVITLE